jgi:hypothetical protein
MTICDKYLYAENKEYFNLKFFMQPQQLKKLYKSIDGTKLNDSCSIIFHYYYHSKLPQRLFYHIRCKQYTITCFQCRFHWICLLCKYVYIIFRICYLVENGRMNTLHVVWNSLLFEVKGQYYVP